jgi:hypothetical protein
VVGRNNNDDIHAIFSFFVEINQAINYHHVWN